MNEMIVSDLMTDEVVTLKRNEELVIAEQLMNLGRIRHLPVVDDENELSVVGIVSQRDLFHGGLLQALGYGSVAKEKFLASLKVKEVMHAPVMTTQPDTLVGDAARTMLAYKVGCLPVVKDGALVGILTESDFVRLFAQRLQ